MKHIVGNNRGWQYGQTLISQLYVKPHCGTLKPTVIEAKENTSIYFIVGVFIGKKYL